MDQGASTSLNPNEYDIPGYGSTTPGPSREDQQVMGAQSTATTARSTMLNGTGASHGVSGPWDMDGEVVAASAAQVGEAVGEEEAQASTEDQRAEETTGRAGPAQMKASRVGAFLPRYLRQSRVWSRLRRPSGQSLRKLPEGRGQLGQRAQRGLRVQVMLPRFQRVTQWTWQGEEELHFLEVRKGCFLLSKLCGWRTWPRLPL